MSHSTGDNVRAAVRRCGAVLGGHWLFAVLLAVGAALRIVATLAYRPALLYSDSVDYLHFAAGGGVSAWHPPAYSWFLAPFVRLHVVGVVPLVQHVIVVGASFLLYVLLLRHSVSRWVAALACTPVLLDGYQIQIEQYVLSDALFEALLICFLATLLWETHISVRRALISGLLLSTAALVRLDAVVLIAPVIAVLLLRRLPRQALVATVAFVVPLLAISGAEAWAGGGFGLTGRETGLWLYSRVAPFADCSSMHVPSNERSLCPSEPPDRRPSLVWYQGNVDSPVHRILRARPDGNKLLKDFARRTIESQPLDYIHAVARDYAFQFRPSRTTTPDGATASQWHFPLRLAPVSPGQPEPSTVARQFDLGTPRLDRTLARFLHSYQRFGYTPGPVMLILIALAVIGAVRHRRRPGVSAAAALTLSFGVLSVLWAAATVMFSWRYMLPTLITLPPAAAFGFGYERKKSV